MMKTNFKGIGKQFSGTNGGTTAKNRVVLLYVWETPFVVFISPVFLLLWGFCCIGIAFVFGCICRHAMYEQLIESGSILRTDLVVHENRGLVSSNRLPKMSENKPASIYSSKTSTDASMGQRLFVDMQNIDAGLLSSETRITQAMVAIVTARGFTMLSYHCHAFQPMGVSCVVVLLEGHISVRAWPLKGIILLDLFTRGPRPLFSLLPFIQKTFGFFPSSTDMIERPNMNWSHKKSGDGVQGLDIDRFIVGWIEFDMKTIVASFETDFQTIDIYDVINPRFLSWEQHLKSLTTTYNDDGTVTYESLHPELFRPDRFLFRNGVLQSRRLGDHAYHEALVHPALITHPHPKRVAIIGGGDGATLREVLKHNTIESVVLVEIDPQMVDVARQYLPEWNDCGNMEGRSASCFDDATADLQLVDAGQWFIDRFVNPDTIKEEDKFDVIIMDSLDPQVEFSSTLSSDDFIQSIVISLTEDGVFVAPIGKDDLPGRIPDDYFEEQSFVERLAASGGFVSLKTYLEAHGGLYRPWKFAIALTSEESKFRWFRNPAEIDAQIRWRLVGANDGSDSLFDYYDGATQASYHDPSRLTEIAYCRKVPTPPYCENGHGLDPHRENIHIQSLEVRPSQIEGAGRGIFFQRDFPQGTYVSIDSCASNVFFMASTTRVIDELGQLGYTDQWKTFQYYLFGYGFSHDYYGDIGFSVDESILTFINHGCNGTYNMGEDTPFTELDAETDEMPDILFDSVLEMSVYSPFIERNHLIYLNAWDVLRRDVKAGEELLDNYLHYLHAGNWQSGVLDYRAQCLKQAAGVIRLYEQEAFIAPTL